MKQADRFLQKVLDNPDGAEVVRDAFLEMFDKIGVEPEFGTFVVGDQVIEDAYAFFFFDRSALILRAEPVESDTAAVAVHDMREVFAAGRQALN